MSVNILRQVLEYFEKNNAPLSLIAVAQEMNISPSLLDSMIQGLVRNGYLQEVTNNCDNCGIQGNCPFAMKTPHCYQIVPEDDITMEEQNE